MIPSLSLKDSTLALLMIGIAAALIAYRRGFFTTSEGFEDAPPPEVPNPAVPDPQTTDSGTKKFNDLRDLIKNTLDQVERAGGDTALQNRVPPEDLAGLTTALEALRSTLRLMPEPVTESKAQQLQGAGVRLSVLEFIVRDQARIVQASLLKRKTPSVPVPAPAPLPTDNAVKRNEDLSAALSDLVQSSGSVNLAEGFGSMQNPYNTPSPDMNQAYQFKLGHLMLTDSILK